MVLSQVIENTRELLDHCMSRNYTCSCVKKEEIGTKEIAEHMVPVVRGQEGSGKTDKIGRKANTAKEAEF